MVSSFGETPIEYSANTLYPIIPKIIDVVNNMAAGEAVETDTKAGPGQKPTIPQPIPKSTDPPMRPLSSEIFSLLVFFEVWPKESRRAIMFLPMK